MCTLHSLKIDGLSINTSTKSYYADFRANNSLSDLILDVFTLYLGVEGNLRAPNGLALAAHHLKQWQYKENRKPTLLTLRETPIF